MDTDTHGLKIGTKLYGYVLAKRYTSLIVSAGNTVNPDTQDTELAAVPEELVFARMQNCYRDRRNSGMCFQIPAFAGYGER